MDCTTVVGEFRSRLERHRSLMYIRTVILFACRASSQNIQLIQPNDTNLWKLLAESSTIESIAASHNTLTYRQQKPPMTVNQAFRPPSGLFMGCHGGSSFGPPSAGFAFSSSGLSGLLSMSSSLSVAFVSSGCSKSVPEGGLDSFSSFSFSPSPRVELDWSMWSCLLSGSISRKSGKSLSHMYLSREVEARITNETGSQTRLCTQAVVYKRVLQNSRRREFYMSIPTYLETCRRGACPLCARQFLYRCMQPCGNRFACTGLEVRLGISLSTRAWKAEQARRHP